MSVEPSKTSPFFSHEPFNPKEKAVEGLTFRSGEIAKAISSIKKIINSSSRISRLLSKIGLGPKAKELRSLKKEYHDLQKMLTSLGSNLKSDNKPQLSPSDTLENLQNQIVSKKTEKTAITATIRQIEKAITLIEKPYHDAIIFQAISDSGLGDIASVDQQTVKLMDMLKAQLCGLKHGLSKTETDLEVLTALVNQLEPTTNFLANLQNSLDSSNNLLDFVEANRDKSYACMDEIRSGTLKNLQLDAKRREILQTLDAKLSSLDGTPMPASIACEHLRKNKKKDLPNLENIDINLCANIQKWHQTIPNFDASRNTLGRRDLTVVHLAGNALENPKVENQLVLEVARVAHVCNMLEQQIKAKWPNANEKEVRQLVSDTVTLMAIDFNYTSVLTDLHTAIRYQLLTDEESYSNRRIIPGDTTNPEYTLILGDGDTPSCTVTCNKKFIDLEGDSDQPVVHGNFSLTSTFTRGIYDDAFTGNVSIVTITD